MRLPICMSGRSQVLSQKRLAQAAKSGRATFFLNMTVPKAVGLTGTFIDLDAIQ